MASNTYLRASVNQKDREVLDRFCAAVGLGKIYGPYLTTTTPWSWQLHGDQVRLLIERLWPWLSRIKREQALRAYAKFEARGESQKGGHICAPDCTCGRQKWKNATDVDPKIARRRAQQREATRRYREKLKARDVPAQPAQ